MAVSSDGGLEAIPLGPFGLFAEEGFDARLQGGDRGTELMGGIGEKAAGYHVL